MRDSHPLVLSVMGGAVIFSGQLLPLLAFPITAIFALLPVYGVKQRPEFARQCSSSAGRTAEAA